MCNQSIEISNGSLRAGCVAISFDQSNQRCTVAVWWSRSVTAGGDERDLVKGEVVLLQRPVMERRSCLSAFMERSEKEKRVSWWRMIFHQRRQLGRERGDEGRGRGICRCERGGGVGAAVLMEKEEEEDKIRGVRLLSPVFHRNRWCSGDEDDKGMKKEGKIG
ncbi:hypothetical protein HAX54_027894 [Datura stramonium]|uniref:Uncharacterized protein n=1 Tax=Datura stramonium TaxID=4076 RepID=A0ABS8V3K3_DATST|nr:hypothetical protein [Datura stramonium]